MRLPLIFAGLLAAMPALAVEGMWTPEQLPEISEALTRAGLQLDPAALSDLRGQPMGAVVSLGGCTASFVSPRGLVVTNHHCAYGALQLNSTPENHMLRDGFIAASLADEPSAGPAARIWVTEDISDVTGTVLGAISRKATDRQRNDAIEAAQKRLVAECEADGQYRCRVFSHFGGVQYRLFRQMEIRDVRIAYAPPEAIGKFGGDTDNWQWPRHTGDFTFYRAYVGPDGKPAPFSKDNVPYRPRHFLPIAKDGVAEGDFVMVAGYPGRTQRYQLADQIEDAISWSYPTQIEIFDDLMALIRSAGEADPKVAITYVATMAGLNNARKNMAGMLEGFRRADAAGIKRGEENALVAWLQSQGRSGKAALDNYRQYVDLINGQRATRERDRIMAMMSGSGLIGSANTLYRLARERAKTDDALREAGYQERDWPVLEAGQRQLDRRMDPGVDRRILGYWLAKYAALPAAQRLPELDAWAGLSGDAPATDGLKARIDALYAGTRLDTLDARLAAFTATPAELEASDDGFLRLAAALYPAMQRLEAERKTFNGAVARLQPGYMQALIDFRDSQDRATYPDANSSLRITFGNVMGVSPRDGLYYQPFTTTRGLVEKHTGEGEFDATAAQLDAIAARRFGTWEVPALKDVPVNYLADLDVTGGNSGSPTLNAKGELVGLIFDGIWESVASNWVFDPALTRTIHVDSRYMLWVMDEVHPAPAILEELGVSPHLD
ncbi:S46 family peptidase [Denitratimonas tolerans]|uniref:Dipeptidyl-peptidase n=1 Tax=Denitratimonas tolerans TaxID=1338420 RepID=A0AAW9R1T4_9GAMM|nr:S46 family peptidase [Chiayiivirga sp.]HRQ35915.1 S46 family peptidase [Chiayiivirga sp.]